MNKQQKTKFCLATFLILLLSIASISLDADKAYASETYTGIALNSQTHVYSATSTSSSVLKSYQQGSVLVYRSHADSNWYSAVVFVNGTRHNGFIHKGDVENIFFNQEDLSGIALAAPTGVLEKAAPGAKPLKTYGAGTILRYKTYSENWYEAVVIIRGKRVTGYIPRLHVENRFPEQEDLRGVALKSLTSVYARASESSQKIRSYHEGTVLIYKTFSENWYEATVIINGVRTTGYISKADVENRTEEQRDVRGIALNSPTTVYSRASADSAPLRSYAQGSTLIYKTFTSQWYEASVFINGLRTTGYIPTGHTEAISSERTPLTGVALKTPTNVYGLASRNASVLTTFNRTNQMQLQKLTNNWFTTTVNVGGKSVTGYVHLDDFSADRILTTTTSYSTGFTSAVDIQMTRAPQVSGKSGGWVNASKSQVEYFINSSNFQPNSNEYFQFLVLSQPAGLDVKEINSNILNRNGTLKSTAQAFIDAGTKYNVNEAYLISHAILETGHGTSELAAGVPVDNTGKKVPPENAVHIVYNMYGIGAVDSCPVTCGAKRAFDEGWFTPAEAIVGGAAFVNTYINRGQDTLYKIRWNPISPGHPQYATDIAWATKQTAKIKEIYDLLENFVLVFDVPQYVSQPTTSGNPTAYLADAPATGSVVPFPASTVGENSVNLNFRDKPTTSGSAIIMNIPNGSTIELLGSNGTWFNARFGGKTGWVHGDYISVLNLLQVNVPTLNVRSNPSATGTALGALKSGEYVSGILDKDKKLVRSGVWYQINYKGSKGWVSGGTATSKYIIER